MRGWLRGKPRGALAFVLIAALVLGGLGWVTAAALRLEHEQHEASARADHAERLRGAQRQRDQALAALRRQAEQDHDQDMQEFNAKLRLALWRLDGRIAPVLAREDGRPYNHYHAVFAPPVALDNTGTAYEPATVLEPSPLLNAELPEWMVLHFQTSTEAGWGSPHVLSPGYKKHLSSNSIAFGNVTPLRQKSLNDLSRSWSFTSLQGQLKRQESLMAASTELEAQVNFEQNPQTQQQATAGRATANKNFEYGPGQSPYGVGGFQTGGNLMPQQQQKQGFGGGNDAAQDRRNRDLGYGFNTRMGQRLQSSQEGKAGVYDDNAWAVMQNMFNNGLPPGKDGKINDKRKVVKARDQVLVRMGSLTPVWLMDKDGSERLVVARRVSIGSRWTEGLAVLTGWPRPGLPVNMALLSLTQCERVKKQHPREVCQGILLDWQRLQRLLADEVTDLFPQAKVAPLREDVPPRPDRTMTALPVELDPGAAPAPPAAPGPEDLPEDLRRDPAQPDAPDLGWTPLRVGLGLSWVAALIALGAVGLGGWSLIDLSERRIRFVSAVTHELRTPLTTLRLYLDMLTGGMVTDEERRDEYLQTLNAEADRLNRLVSNVLDFSRLEKQHPQLVKTEVPVADLLEQVRATWEQRCRDVEKVLTFDDATAGAAATTDVQLVQQVLGNLIDNACKYSRGADDAHIWVRAKVADGKRLIFEVEDRGPGVPQGERRSIFRAFCRGGQADVTAGGVGLGLALAQRWAGLLGGKLTLCSDAGRVGACFRVELPLR